MPCVRRRAKARLLPAATPTVRRRLPRLATASGCGFRVGGRRVRAAFHPCIARESRRNHPARGFPAGFGVGTTRRRMRRLAVADSLLLRCRRRRQAGAAPEGGIGARRQPYQRRRSATRDTEAIGDARSAASVVSMLVPPATPTTARTLAGAPKRRKRQPPESAPAGPGGRIRRCEPPPGALSTARTRMAGRAQLLDRPAPKHAMASASPAPDTDHACRTLSTWIPADRKSVV